MSTYETLMLTFGLLLIALISYKLKCLETGTFLYAKRKDKKDKPFKTIKIYFLDIK